MCFKHLPVRKHIKIIVKVVKSLKMSPNIKVLVFFLKMRITGSYHSSGAGVEIIPKQLSLPFGTELSVQGTHSINVFVNY